MAGERYVVLGLAPARAAWFRAVGSWANSGAVLIMAAVGALMWVGIKQLWGTASSQTNSQMSKIGQ